MIDIPTKNGVMGLQYNGANEEIKLFVDVDGRQLTAKLEIAAARQLADLLARLAYYGAEAQKSSQASRRQPFIDDFNDRKTSH